MNLTSVLALAAALSAAGAYASQSGDCQLNEKYIPQSVMNEISVFNPKGATMLPTRSDDFSIEGEYLLYIDDHYFKDGAGETSVRCSIADNGDGTITISAKDYFLTDIVGDFNYDTNVVTFTARELGLTSVNGKSFYVRYEPGYYDAAAKKTVAEDFSVSFNPIDGTIDFPENHSFGWEAYTSSSYKSSVGSVRLFDVQKLEPYIPLDEEHADEWDLVGYATFEDAWVTSALVVDGESVDPAEFPYDVELHQNLANPNLYRLWRPYHSEGSLVHALNTSEFQGQIQFDISDPEHVIVVPGIPAGVNIGQGEMYMFDILGWQIWMQGDNYTESLFPQIVAFMEANNQPASTFQDGTLTVNYSVFDVDAACTHAYSWPTVQYRTSIIYFPEEAGIDEVQTYGPSEAIYYNIQGVRVNNPEKGLFIRIENGKATKVIK